MFFVILLTSLAWQICPTTALNSIRSTNNTCPYQNTVNLKNHQHFVNGSYLYEDLIIPREKQKSYNYYMKYSKIKKSISPYLRGCVCEEKPCISMCCEKDEYLSVHKNVVKCKKLNSNAKMSLRLILKDDNKIINLRKEQVFQHFTTQVGLPCRQPKALNITKDKWILDKDRILHTTMDNLTYNTLDYCYSPILNDITKEYKLTPYICVQKCVPSVLILVNSYAMIASVLFLILTIVVYLVLKELRESLGGKLMISYQISLTLSYGIISFINTSGMRFDLISCSFLGFTCYFFLVGSFLWLNVLCYDMWKKMRRPYNTESNSGKEFKQFILYSLYVWLSAGAATAVSVTVELLPNLDDIYKPGIDKERCWLNTERWSAAIYLYGPTLIILLLNLATFFRVSINICVVQCDLAKLNAKEILFRESVIVIYRLYLIMGISWIFDVISYCFMSMRNEMKYQLYFALPDFINAIQGFLIFLLFVLKPNVLHLLKTKCFPTSPANCLELQICNKEPPNVAV